MRGSDVKRLRLRLGLSYRTFGNLIGVDRRTMIRWEAKAENDVPAGVLAIRLLRALWQVAASSKNIEELQGRARQYTQKSDPLGGLRLLLDDYQEVRHDHDAAVGVPDVSDAGDERHGNGSE